MSRLLSDADGGWESRVYSADIAAEIAADYAEEIAGWACGAEGAWRLLMAMATYEPSNMRGVPFDETG